MALPVLVRAGKPGTTFVRCFCLPQGLEHTVDADRLALRGRIPELVKAICSGISSMKPPLISPADSRFLPSQDSVSLPAHPWLNFITVLCRNGSSPRDTTLEVPRGTGLVLSSFSHLTQCLACADNIDNNNTENYHFQTLCAKHYSKYLTWTNGSIITTVL